MGLKDKLNKIIHKSEVDPFDKWITDMAAEMNAELQEVTQNKQLKLVGFTTHHQAELYIIHDKDNRLANLPAICDQADETSLKALKTSILELTQAGSPDLHVVGQIKRDTSNGQRRVFWGESKTPQDLDTDEIVKDNLEDTIADIVENNEAEFVKNPDTSPNTPQQTYGM